jgi:S-adenosylmethionine:tRNA ribosyltransferase-isomerase
MRTEDFNYPLPPERIAQVPAAERDASRLLHLDAAGAISDHRFRDLPALLQPGDLLVANDTRVRRARLRGIDGRGRAVELLLLDRITGDEYSCLARPARRLTPGTEVSLGAGLTAAVIGAADAHSGERVVRLRAAGGDVERAVFDAGEAPVPPYIHGFRGDPDRYQAVYARGAPRSAAAPTAGLHFTERVIDALRARGVGWTTVRLDVGLGTFAPMRTDTIEAHVMHRESYEVPASAADAIAHTRASGGRVVAVGTTVVRVLEACADDDGIPRIGSGSTELFIRPGHRFRGVMGLLTNFHQPRSSLLVLLAAFIGDRWRGAYQHALCSGYRFLSFGDCMLCWRT